MNWFEEWFNSPYYHQLYCNRNESEAENFIERLSVFLKIPKGAKVIDVACGKGRHSKTLAKLGFDVTGIDLASNSITAAKQFENEHLKFAVHDMREVYRTNEFDFVFNLFSSFGYFENSEDDARAIEAMYKNLKPAGTLVLDYLNTEWVVKQIKPRDIIQRDDVQFHIQKKIENGFIKKRIEFLADGVNHHYEETLKVINRFKFEEMLKQAGFEIKKVFGDYDLSEFVAASSPRLILIAEKK